MWYAFHSVKLETKTGKIVKVDKIYECKQKQHPLLFFDNQVHFMEMVLQYAT